jgi:hypothetical protein
MLIELHGYVIQYTEGPRHYISLTAPGRAGRHDVVKAAWGRKAASAIKQFAKLRADEDAEPLRLWLCMKSSNGF